MQHYVVEITYCVPLARIEETVAAHRAHLQGGYEQGLLLASGPQIPREGGILLARAPSREALEEFLAKDPYSLQELVEYRLIEFQPVKHQNWAAAWFTAV